MKLEDQVVSLELAKKLQELGVTGAKGERHFWWRHLFATDAGEAVDHGWHLMDYSPRESMQNFQVQTFSVAELGEMLPARIEHNGLLYFLELLKNGPNPKIGRVWHCFYAVPSDGGGYAALFECDDADTEADARAMMLIYLIENGLTTAPALNPEHG